MDSKLEITNLITPIIKIYNLLGNEWKNLLENGLNDYIHTQTKKYYFTTTFAHRTEVRFDDIYYPLTATYKDLVTDFTNLSELFENYNNITIVGSAGSGKSTLMKFIFLNSIRASYKIPLLIELRYLNQYNGNFEKLIYDKILKQEIKPSEDILNRTLKAGKFIFLLDGYDEIFSAKKQELNRQIDDFVDQFPDNNFVITTRPGSGIEGFHRFKDFRINQLDNQQVEGFIKKIVESDERKQRILSVISEKANSPYLEYLRNPLLLSMFILAFESHPEIPAKKSSFYRNVFDTLYSKHDGITKNSFPREKLTKLDRDQFEKALNIFCYLTLINGDYTFTNEILNDVMQKVLQNTGFKCNIEDLIYDLHTTISILILDGFEYSFPHRSMQEYFAAQFLSKLPSESKAKAYTNLNNALVKSSTDNSHNLWSISMELDESAFKKNFLIPQLKKVEKKLNVDNNKLLLFQFIKICNASLYYSRIHDAKKREFMFIRPTTFFSSLIRFCKIFNFIPFAKFAFEKQIKDDLLPIYNNRNKSLLKPKFLMKVDDEVLEVLLKHDLVKMISDIKANIGAKIKQFEEEIKTSKEKIDDLLNL